MPQWLCFLNFSQFKKTLLFFLTLFAITLHADMVRIGLFVGNNQGLATDRPLKYARRDAKEMAQIFARMGGIEKDRVYLLEEPSMDVLNANLREIKGRMKELVNKNHKVLFLFYYSGHGSESALHIAGKRWERKQIHEVLDSIPADFKLAMIDACESGGLLRQKGALVITTPKIEATHSIEHKGLVILSSSSRVEQAQESQSYQGAVFSHHVLTGLRGAADFNNDDQVSLWETFQYAASATRSERIYGNQNAQNPGFDADMVGEDDFALTSLHREGAKVVFSNFSSMPIDVYEQNQSALIGRIFLNGREEVRLDLPAKSYIFAYRQGNRTFAAPVNLQWRQLVKLTPASFSAYSSQAVLRKGGDEIFLSRLNLGLGYRKFTYGPLAGSQQAVASTFWATPWGMLGFSIGGGIDGYTKNLVSVQNALYTLGLDYRKPFLYQRYGFSFVDISIESGWFNQEQVFDRGGVKPEGYILPISTNSYLPVMSNLSLGYSFLLPKSWRLNFQSGAYIGHYMLLDNKFDDPNESNKSTLNSIGMEQMYFPTWLPLRVSLSVGW